jgi:hypothetical protein
MNARRSDDELLRALPGLARIAGTAWVRTADWSARAALGAGSRLVRAAASGDPPTDVLRHTGEDVRDYARRLLGIVDRGEDAEQAPEPEPKPPRPEMEATLRERGADLLRRSADVREDEAVHPAYARILDDLAPDEGRILRLLAREGAQPSVDIRAGMPMASRLVAPGRNMMGAQAGCRYLARVPAYLNNLSRLGLIWFSRESLEDPARYQVLEAQPEVVDAMRKAGRTGRTVRRSILLTPFGRDFCGAALPFQTVEPDALSDPGTSAPADGPD